MWFILQLMFGLLALGVSTFHAYLMSQRAVEASALGESSLSAMAYGMVAFHLLLAAIALSLLYFVIQRQRALNSSQR